MSWCLRFADVPAWGWSRRDCDSANCEPTPVPVIVIHIYAAPFALFSILASGSFIFRRRDLTLLRDCYLHGRPRLHFVWSPTQWTIPHLHIFMYVPFRAKVPHSFQVVQYILLTFTDSSVYFLNILPQTLIILPSICHE